MNKHDIKKVVLAYSGGLDTSVILRWLQDHYRAEVITFTADIGQGEEVEPARKKAELLGVKEIFIDDLKEEFVKDFVFPMFRANALYEGVYLLGTSLARLLIAKRQIEIANLTGSDAVSHGGEIVLGGKRELGSDNFLNPTIITGATKEMACSSEETFGPFAPLFKFKDEDEVIGLANDTIFGLASYFYANDLSRVYKVAEALEYGMVGINTGLISTEVAPFGGVKQSGLGREGSRHGIEDYLEMKYLCISV